MAKRHPNLLLVEGEQEKRTIPYLIEANGIDWGTKNNPVVYIEPLGGDTNVINPLLISTELKASGRRALGLMVDADEHPFKRWQSVRNACLTAIPDIPEQLPETGLIHCLPNDIKFGVWIMPDNKMRGMLETFLAYMIPDKSEPLWEYAQEAVSAAKDKNAPFIEQHVDKAHIFTWLAWQKPPGRQLHNAIRSKILDPKHPQAQTFVSWFKSLYNL